MIQNDGRAERGHPHQAEATFNLFVYGTLGSSGIENARLAGCTRLTDGHVSGTLYDINGRHPALVPYGSDTIRGEVWQCPADLLPQLDAYEGLESGLFRRIGAEIETAIGEIPCWLYAAGPALSRELTPENRVRSLPPSGQPD